MELEEYKRFWESRDTELNCFPPEVLTGKGLKISEIDFLNQFGLPTSAAPFLAFEFKDSQKMIGTDELLGIDWPGLDKFPVIGSNGSGDTICISLDAKCEVVYLNHDNGFQPVFMNSSIICLGLCLVKYEEFHSSLRSPGTVGSTSETNNVMFQNLYEEFERIDNRALIPGSFWLDELNYLKLEQAQS